ncbi:MAG: Type I Iterative PKS [Bogoriella megaspora]|nr:MAG: Type I Iterative PKS [Bogoriella megaspora]
MVSISQDSEPPMAAENPVYTNGITDNHDSPDPIAVIGFALKFPGEARNVEGFWDMLVNGRCAMTDFPKDRINLDGHYHPDASHLDELPVRGGHFIEESIDRFDAPFFSITPAEAACMEPQQRGILEVAFHALENAGVRIDDCSGTRTSVHTGSFTDDYRSVLFQDPLDGHTYAASGLSSSMLANRVSWFFNLKGPSINLDTACSSSLTSLHLACQDLRSGATTMGLVGGCNLFYHPDYMKIMSNMGFLSPDSRSWSLDERANGYARGEGFGMLVLKRLSDAVKDGDTVRAVIRASGLNQDGRTPGITVPSGDAHNTLMRETYARANIDMEPTRFFEAHATGTQAGDPTEANAIGQAFEHVRSKSDPLYVGAVKSNIGHLEAGSGVASVIKSILVLEKGIIPPNAGFERLNKRVQAERYHLNIPKEAKPWPTRGLRRVCVNSFGFGGSNAVVILDDAHHFPLSQGYKTHHRTTIEPPSAEDVNVVGRKANTNRIGEKPQSRPGLLVWSANDEDGVKRLQARLQQFFEQHAHKLHDEDLRDIVYTLGMKRTNLSWRSFVTFSSLQDLRNTLSTKLSKAKGSFGRHLAFAFTGQGAQYVTMGKKLMHFHSFRESIKSCEKLLTSLGSGWQLTEAMFSMQDPDQVNKPQFSQPLCTALQIALVDLLETLGIKPSAVVGHSSGEIAAAYCVGALSRQDALKVAFLRGRLAAKLVGGSSPKLSMMAASISEIEANRYLSKLEQRFDASRVDIACINSPRNVTLSGDEVQLDYLQQLMQTDEKSCRKLRVNVAYHSRFMAAIAKEYKSQLGDLSGGSTVQGNHPTVYSSVTGGLVHASDMSTAEYWVRNLTSPVKFSSAISTMAAQSGKGRKVLGAKPRKSLKISDVLEVGPHHALRGPILESLQTSGKADEIQYHPSLARNSPSAISDILNTAGRLFCLGYPVDILEANGLPHEARTLRTDLPEYAFQHSQSHWRESRIGRNYRLRDTPRHDFLGVKSSDWNPLQAQWRNFISKDRLPWLQDHRLAGDFLYPAGGMVVMAIEAAKQLARGNGDPTSYELREIQFLNAFRVLHRDDPIETRFSMSPIPENPAWFHFQLFVYDEDIWNEVCRGEIRTHFVGKDFDISRHLRHWDTSTFLDKLNKSSQSLSREALYRQFANVHDAEYGPAFQTLKNIFTSSSGAVKADINTVQWAKAYGSQHVSAHIVHPSTLDSLFQLVFPAFDPNGGTKVTLVPTRVQRMWLNAKGLGTSGDVIRVIGECSTRGYRGTDVRARAFSLENDEPLIELESYETTIVATSAADPGDAFEQRKLCAQIRWMPDVDSMTPSELQIVTAAPPRKRKSTPDFYRDLHSVIRYFIFDSLVRLRGAGLPTTSPSHAGKLIRWMHYQMRGSEFADYEPGRRMVRDETFRKRMIDYTKRFSAEGRVLTTLGENLFDIIRGEADPIQLLFEGSLASDYYEELMSEGPYIPSLTKYLELLAHKNPAMRVLEIGAGTGSSAQPLLDALSDQGRPRWSEYVFTDVSSGFFPEAEKKFSQFSYCMTYCMLDAAIDPSQQGFEESSYDVVVAGNVLHALRDLRATLGYILRLLKPGGKLILFETTSPDTIRTGLFGGVLKDWWNGIKDQERHTPLLSIDSWHQELQDAGYTGLDMAIKDFEDPEICEQSVLVTSAAQQRDCRLNTTEIVILIDTEVLAQKRLAGSLQEKLSTGGAVCGIVGIDSTSLMNMPQKTCISLLEVGRPFLATLKQQSFESLKTMLTSCPVILWISQGIQTPLPPEYGMINGFARVLRTEYPLLKLVTLFLEPQNDQPVDRYSDTIFGVLQRMLSTEDYQTEYEYSERDGLVNINRVIHSDSMNEMVALRSSGHQVVKECLRDLPPLQLHVQSPGLLDSVRYQQVEELHQNLSDSEVLIRVSAFGLTPRDYLIASGQLNENEFGMQCAGTVAAAGRSTGLEVGSRVCVAGLSMFSTLLRCNGGSVVRVPDDLSFADAASLPIPAMLAVHTLISTAHLQSGETVLIDNAFSAVGQMMIQIAISLDTRVFVLVQSIEQRQQLQTTYNIPEQDIFLTTDVAIRGAILNATNCQGVDVVVNFAAGEDSETAWNCLSSFGRFFHVTGQDIDIPTRMKQFSSNILISRVNIAELLRARPFFAFKTLAKVQEMIRDRNIRPPKGIKAFSAAEVSEALRVFKGNEESRVLCGSVIELDPQNTLKATIETRPLYTLDSNSTYVIAGGLGGLGRSISWWMAERGARHLLLLSRSGTSKPRARAIVDKLVQRGVHVSAPVCDIANQDQLRKVIEDASCTMPPIRGCIQAAMVLRDAVFDNLTWKDWEESTRPKVQGSWNLHTTLPKDLQFFVLLSSVSAILGGVSQSSYAAGNAYKDAICHYRNALGLRASVMNLGMMVSEGVVAETEGLLASLREMGQMMEISQAEMFALLEYHCDPSRIPTNPEEFQTIFGIQLPSEMISKGQDVPNYLNRPLFRHFHFTEAGKAASGPKHGDQVDYASIISKASSAEDAAVEMTKWLVIKISGVLGLSQDDIDVSRPMSSYGIDSLLGMELRNWFERELGAKFPIFELLSSSSMADLCQNAAIKTKFRHKD